LGLNDYEIPYTTAPLFVKFLKMNVKEIAAGSNHNLVLTKNNELYAWGCNKFGQCG
jgi:alpha-tubulin suppressor-like RCC1 family protein